MQDVKTEVVTIKVNEDKWEQKSEYHSIYCFPDVGKLSNDIETVSRNWTHYGYSVISVTHIDAALIYAESRTEYPRTIGKVGTGQKYYGGFGYGSSIPYAVMLTFGKEFSNIEYEEHEGQYLDAMELYYDKQYNSAKDLFSTMLNYKDSGRMLFRIDNEIEYRYKEALSLYKDKKYSESISLFEVIRDYKNSEDLIDNLKKNASYLEAKKLYDKKQYTKACELLLPIADFKNSREIIETLRMLVDGKRAKIKADFKI